MKKKTSVFFLSILVVLISWNCKSKETIADGNSDQKISKEEKSKNRKKPLITDDQRLVSYLSGKFSTAQQAYVDSSFYSIEMRLEPIKRNKEEEGVWMYLEQALSETPNKPYRQRLYEIKYTKDKELIADVYTIPNEELYVGKFSSSKSFDTIKLENLYWEAGCELIFRYDEVQEVYKGKTIGQNCLNNYKGASYLESEMEISKKGVEIWNRGYDFAGTQVWGNADIGYKFVRKGGDLGVFDSNMLSIQDSKDSIKDTQIKDSFNDVSVHQSQNNNDSLVISSQNTLKEDRT